MYTIIMNSDKSLVTSLKTTLYQRETMVDKISFLFPQFYEPTDLDITTCMILLKYTDQGNVAHAIKLTPDEELYKDHVKCEMDVDIELTRFAGDIKAYVDFLKLNHDNGLYESVLTSGEVIITILPRDDYFAYCADKSLDIINRKMLELQAKTEALESIADVYDNSKADNIIKTDEEQGSAIQLTSHGVPIGDKITIKEPDNTGVDVTLFDTSPSETPDSEDYNVVEF